MHAIGSSYLIRQAAGAERFGGVTVRLKPRNGSDGSLEIVPTDWRTDEEIDDDISYLADASIAGIKRFADNNAINLQEWDVTVSKFAYHPVDSGRLTVQIAAYNAFASAWASWNQLQIPNAENAG